MRPHITEQDKRRGHYHVRKTWTSKNRKWKIEITDAFWPRLGRVRHWDVFPYANGMITDLRTNRIQYFKAISQQPVGAYRVENLMIVWGAGGRPELEIPAYVQEKVIELSNRALIEARSGNVRGFGAVPPGVFVQCHPTFGATGFWQSDNMKWRVRLREASLSPEGLLVEGTINKLTGRGGMLVWDYLEGSDTLDFYEYIPGDGKRFLVGTRLMDVRRKKKVPAPKYVLEVIRAMIRGAGNCLHTGLPV